MKYTDVEWKWSHLLKYAKPCLNWGWYQLVRFIGLFFFFFWMVCFRLISNEKWGVNNFSTTFSPYYYYYFFSILIITNHLNVLWSIISMLCSFMSSRVRKEDETILAEYWSFSKQWMMKIILGFNGSFDLKIQ